MVLERAMVAFLNWFLLGAVDLVQAALWPRYSSPRPKAAGLYRSYEQSDRRVDRRSGD